MLKNIENKLWLQGQCHNSNAIKDSPKLLVLESRILYFEQCI